MTVGPRLTWIGWCLLLGMAASCASPGDTGGTGGAGGKCSTGCASGGTTGTGGGATGGGASGGAAGQNGSAGASGGSGGGQVVGTSGGLVTQSGVTLDVPADAVPGATMITVAATSAPGGYVLASEAYQFGPSGTQFQLPVTVTIPLTSATTGVHLFWSNASGGFDDIGGTITGSTLTAQVGHFSIGFCAVPKVSSGSGGATAAGGASGASGSSGAAGAGAGGNSSSSGAGGTSGAAGSSGSGAGGTSGAAGSSGSGAGGNSSSSGAGGSSGAAGSSGSGVGGTSGTAGSSGTGAAGSSGAAGASGPTDGGLSGDAAASLCKQFGLNLPFATVSYPEAGSAPDSSAYTGGTLVSGKVYLRSVIHYGGGTYAGSKQAQYTIDATAHTIAFGEFTQSAPGSQFTAMTYTVVAPNTLQVTVVCNSGTTPTGTFDMYYSVNGMQTTLTTVGSNDVLVIGSLNGA